MQQLLSSAHNGVLKLTIHRPAQKNAINASMYSELADLLEKANAQSDIRCVLITGFGDIFTAGNDLQDFVNPSQNEDLPAVRFLYALVKLEKPIIAAVNGPAIGIGLTMLLHCDIVLAAQSASFTAPFTRLGLVPEAASSMLLPDIVGRAMANDILLAGRRITSDEALSCGLISRVVEDQKLSQFAEEMADNLADLPANAMQKSKALINDSRRALILDVIEKELTVFAQQLQSEEFALAVKPLLSKNKD